TDVGILGRDGSNEWAPWILEETHRATLPLSKITDTDTVPLGLAIDFTSPDTLPPLENDTDEPPMSPVPIVMMFNNDGLISAYNCINVEVAKDRGKYSGMMEPKAIPGGGPTTSVPQKSEE